MGTEQSTSRALTCSRAGTQPIAGGAPFGWVGGRGLEGPIRRSPSVSTWLSWSGEGDVGGRQGLVGVSLETLHSDIDQGVVGAGSRGRGLGRADGHLIHHNLVAVGTEQRAGRVALGDGGEREQREGGGGVSEQQQGLILLEELPGRGAGAAAGPAGPLEETFTPLLLLPGGRLGLLRRKQLAPAGFQEVEAQARGGKDGPAAQQSHLTAAVLAAAPLEAVGGRQLRGTGGRVDGGGLLLGSVAGGPIPILSSRERDAEVGLAR